MPRVPKAASPNSHTSCTSARWAVMCTHCCPPSTCQKGLRPAPASPREDVSSSPPCSPGSEPRGCPLLMRRPCFPPFQLFPLFLSVPPTSGPMASGLEEGQGDRPRWLAWLSRGRWTSAHGTGRRLLLVPRLTGCRPRRVHRAMGLVPVLLSPEQGPVSPW